MQSETIKEVAAALARVQAEVAQPKKRSTNPFHKSKYADLGECFDCVRELLPKHGLVLTQLFNGDALDTLLVHTESGQFITSRHPLPTGQTPQQFGSSATYARRYAICAMFGLVAEKDDDANEASGLTTQSPQAAQAAATGRQAMLAKMAKGGA